MTGASPCSRSASSPGPLSCRPRCCFARHPRPAAPPGANPFASGGVPADMTVGQALKTPVFWILSLANFACCAAHSGPIFHMVSYAAYCGVAPLTAATVLGAAGLAALFGRIFCGLLADLTGAKRTLVACLALQALAIALYRAAHELDTLYAVSMLFGFSYGGAMPLYAILVREHFPAKIMGSVFGVVAMIAALGMALGPPVGGWLFDRFGGYGWLYVASSAIGIAAALMAMTVRPHRRARWRSRRQPDAHPQSQHIDKLGGISITFSDDFDPRGDHHLRPAGGGMAAIVRSGGRRCRASPGATLTKSDDDGAYQGTMRVKFGPTVAQFRGEARLAYDHAARRCTIEGRGIDGRGASRANATGVVEASGTDTTRLQVEGTFNVTGPLETFANAGGVHLARALLAEFAENVAKLVAAPAARRPRTMRSRRRRRRRMPRRSSAAARSCRARRRRGCARSFREKRQNERQPSFRHPGPGLCRRGRRHALHPDGRRQHVLVGVDGRQPEGMQVIHARHEHCCVAMADGYARATGKVGVASITCGPGFTQIMTALTIAARGNAPLVVFAGDAPIGASWYIQQIDHGAAGAGDRRAFRADPHDRPGAR